MAERLPRVENQDVFWRDPDKHIPNGWRRVGKDEPLRNDDHFVGRSGDWIPLGQFGDYTDCLHGSGCVIRKAVNHDDRSGRSMGERGPGAHEKERGMKQTQDEFKELVAAIVMMAAWTMGIEAAILISFDYDVDAGARSCRSREQHILTLAGLIENGSELIEEKKEG